MRGALAVASWALVAACTVGPDHEPPERPAPDGWSSDLDRGLSAEPASLERWWSVLGDERLAGLVEDAIEHNPGLMVAAGRILEARSLFDVAEGELWPEFDGIGSYTHSRQGSNSVERLPPEFVGGDRNLWRLGFDTTWEIDVFGRLRRSTEAAHAELGARVEDYRDLLVTLAADVASSYVDLCSLQQRIRIAEANIDSQRSTLELARSRFDAGLVPELDVAQARVNLATTRSTLPALRTAKAAALHRIAVLTGRDPGALVADLDPEGGEPTTVPAAPDRVVIGLPSELLRRRPDVRRAERELAVATAEIGVETAELYPSFSIAGDFVLAATDTDRLFRHDSREYSIGPSVRWRLFTFGRVRAAIRAAEARQIQALHAWEETVLAALEEAENAVVRYVEEQRRRDALAEGEAAARQAVELARTLYVQGVTDFQNVLDAQRTLFDLQDELAVSQRQTTQELIALYKALGGGWENVEPPAPRATLGDADSR